MAHPANTKKRSTSVRRQSNGKSALLSAAEDTPRSDSSVSMALTSADTPNNSSPSVAAKFVPAVSSPLLSLNNTTTGGSSQFAELTIPPRKRSRASTSSHSTSSHNSSSSGNGSKGRRQQQPQATSRSPSATAITTRTESTVIDVWPPLSGTPRLHFSAGDDSASPSRCLQPRLRDSATPVNTEGDDRNGEVFSDASPTVGATATPLRGLQGTPMSQLISQLQDPPYIVQSGDKTGENDEAAAEVAVLFTPATVARRRMPLAVAGESTDIHGGSTNSDRPAGARTTTARSATRTVITPSSGSRSSFHDEAVQAILRANPPTTTRAVELKPGYRVPSPRSPLWAALDADDGESDTDSIGSRNNRRTPGITRSANEDDGELPWLNTQVSLFQEEDEQEAGKGNTRVPALTATQERRRLEGPRPNAQDRISLPGPGRSVNLLEEEDPYDDEQLSLFLSESDVVQVAKEEESSAFSLTQEACKQEREQDHQAALPRSRHRHGTATAALTSSKRGAGVFTTPSPTRRGTRARLSVSQQASPFSQLQHEVDLAMSMVASDGAILPFTSNNVTAAATTSTSKPAALLSQRELRRRADMLKWAERTRAFFYFIDSLPLRVSNSPLKKSDTRISQHEPQQPARRSRSQTITTAVGSQKISAATAGKESARRTVSGTRGGSIVNRATGAASTSLVRRSHSAVAPTESSRHGSSAFEAVVSRVKQEVAAAAKQQQRRSTTNAFRSSTD